MIALARETRAAARKLVSALGIVGILAAILLVFAPISPAAAECKPPGVPDYAGAGITGTIDPRIEDPSGGNNYGEYGWAGLRWNNCDIREFGAPADDLLAVVDTWTGNGLMGAAVGEAAIMTAMHKWTADPSALLAPIDEKIVQLSTITSELFFGEWAYALIVFAAVGVLVAALTRSVRKALVTVLAICAAVTFMAIVSTFPLEIAQSTDGVASSIVSAADAKALEYAGIPANADEGQMYANTDEATGAILNDAMLQPLWRMGQTGSMDWLKTTDDMFMTSTASWAEVDAGYDPAEKRDSYNAAVDVVKNDPATANQYQSVKGQSYNRTGAGAGAMFMMTVVALIRIPAEAYMFLGMLVIRFIPLIGPVFAALAIPEQTRGAAITALKIVAAAVFNVIVFGVIASVHTATTAILYVNPTNLFVSTLLSTLITFLLLKLSKPYRSVTKLATGNQVAKELADAPDAPGNAVKGVVGMATGTVMGNMMTPASKADKLSKKEIRKAENAHPGPENLHAGWREAPEINPAWASAPGEHEGSEFTPEYREGMRDWDEPVFTPQEAEHMAERPGSTPDMTLLIEPEFEGGRMVSNIFVPDQPATVIDQPALIVEDSQNYVKVEQ